MTASISHRLIAIVDPPSRMALRILRLSRRCLISFAHISSLLNSPQQPELYSVPMLRTALLVFVLTLSQAPTTPTPVARLSATMSLGSAPETIRIDVLNWSNDATRSRLIDAWNLILPAAPARGGAPPAGAGAGARGARGARGGGGPPTTPTRGERPDTPEK